MEDIGFEVVEIWPTNFTVLRDVDASARRDFLSSKGVILRK